MVGITSYGAYVPIYRLSRELIGNVWGTSLGKGERATANYDEDSITMAVEAVIDCLNGTERQSIDGLYFASTTPPYREKQCASIIATATDLRKDIFTGDFANSLRAGTNAMKAAIDAINSGAAKKVLIVASDCRLPYPNSADESLFGDGAAAFLLGDSDIAVNIEGGYSTYSEFMETWRREEDRQVQTWEERFVDTVYVQNIQEAISEAMKKYNLEPKDFTKVVFFAPNPRRHREVARRLNLDPKTQVQDPMFDCVGNSGAAFSPMMLVATLEEADAGDRILFASYGDGCDVYILGVTKQIGTIKGRRGIKRHLDSKMMFPIYGDYLRFHNLIDAPPDRDVAENITALTILWRERAQIFSLKGQKCKNCGGIQYPRARICAWCQAKDNFEEYSFADKKGTLFTFSMDDRALELNLPNVIGVADMEGGGRLYSQMTDRDPEKLKVGIPVEATFRRIHEGGGLHNYFWKLRPIRC